MIAQIEDALAQGVPAAVLAQHQLGLRQADVLGIHDLVGGALLEHAVLVDAGFVGEGVLADDGLVALHLNAGDVRDEPAGRVQLACVLMLVAKLEVIAAACARP